MKKLAHAINMNVKLLPKLLRAEIPVQLIEEDEISLKSQIDFSNIDAVLVDDNKHYTDTMVMLGTKKGEKIFAFNNVFSVMQNISLIPKQMKFYLDYDLGEDINGAKVAETLYKKGYQNLYIVSGYSSDEICVPYVKGHINKVDIL